MEELNTKNTQNFTSSQDNDEMQFTIADIWSIFVKNKWWMFAGVVVCLIVAIKFKSWSYKWHYTNPLQI